MDLLIALVDSIVCPEPSVLCFGQTVAWRGWLESRAPAIAALAEVVVVVVVVVVAVAVPLVAVQLKPQALSVHCTACCVTCTPHPRSLCDRTWSVRAGCASSGTISSEKPGRMRWG